MRSSRYIVGPGPNCSNLEYIHDRESASEASAGRESLGRFPPLSPPRILSVGSREEGREAVIEEAGALT